MTAIRTPADVDAAMISTWRRGWYMYGWASHVFPTLITTVFMSRYLGAVAEQAVGKNGRLHVLGVPIAPQSLFVYTVSACTVVAVLLMPVVGAFADRTGYKRDIMLGLGALAAIAVALMYFVRGGNWPLGAALYAVAFVGYSCAAVVNYALLVDLSNAADRDRLSSVGWGFSYLGGGVLLAVAFAVSPVVDPGELARLAMGASGLWWLVFMLPIARQLPRRIGRSAGDLTAGASIFRDGFRQLGHTLRSLRTVPITMLFLAAFLIYNDGIQTVTTVAAQYGQFELGLPQTTLLLAILLVQFVAFFGAVWLGRLAGRFGAKKVVLGSLVVWVAIIVITYGLRPGQSGGFYAVAVAIALVLGGSQALSRSLFSRLIPAGREAEYFGFYEISDSGTSWLGPLIFGLTLQNTGSYRSALGSLIAFFALGFVVLTAVPIRRGILAAGNLPPQRL